MIDTYNKLSEVIMSVFFLIFLYQIIYMAIGFFCKPKRFTAKVKHRFAVVISARNESAVIADLLKSIRSQTYDASLVDIFVVADNCTDNTAEIAAGCGALVYQRFNTVQCGKGYALNYLFERIDHDYGLDSYDGYFVFDADNVLERDYIEQMNSVFDNGYRVVTSYRNSKNYGDNWISAGYGLWFLREARFINNARMILGVSCAVSGTGFLVHKDIIKRHQGWDCFLLTEDIQFSVENILQGEKIGYCDQAMFYDEQPVRFKDAWNQRLRWSKGFYQVFFHYGRRLACNCIKKRSFSCYDMFVTVMPGILFTLVMGFANFIALYSCAANLHLFVRSIIDIWTFALLGTYVTFISLGAVTLLKEWKHIYCKSSKKLLYLLAFPIFMFTYLPISILALFMRIKWSPIPHSVSTSAQEIREQP